MDWRENKPPKLHEIRVIRGENINTKKNAKNFDNEIFLKNEKV